MFKSLVFCVLLWHKIYEINGHADPFSTDSGEQAESKEVRSLHTALLNGSLLERTSLSNNSSCGEKLVTDHVMAKETDVFKVYRVNLKWNSARQMCHDIGGHLAIIRSTSELGIVRQLMTNASVEQAWVGLHDQFEKGDWTSLFDEPVAEIGCAQWHINLLKPANEFTEKNCAKILAKEDGFVREDCISSKPFICREDRPCKFNKSVTFS